MINPFTGNMTFAGKHFPLICAERDLTDYYAGPGFRLPFMAVSPWTRGSNVFTEPADHTSQLLFLEKWLATKGVDIHISAIK